VRDFSRVRWQPRRTRWQFPTANCQFPTTPNTQLPKKPARDR